MKPGEMFGRLAAWSVRHARLLLIASASVALAAAFATTQLPTDAGTGTLVDSGSAEAKATASFHRLFGDDPVEVLIQGDLRRLVLTDNLGKLLRLEGCLSGNVPRGSKPLPGACRELARTRPVKVVYGPATFLNQAAIGIDQALGSQISQTRAQALVAARAAARRVAAQGGGTAAQRSAANAAAGSIGQQFQAALVRVAAKYGITSLPRIDDPLFVSQVVFDTRLAPGTPKSRFAYLFPSRRSALITVRLRSDLTVSERHRALSLIRKAVFDTTPRGACGRQPCFTLNGGSYVVSGVPVVVDGLAGVLKDAFVVLFAAAVVLMALTLGLVFGSRLRLLPLAIALGACAITFAALGLLGGALTMASIAVLPVLIGLGVDYAIQLQSRFDEARAGGLSGPQAARAAATRAAPVIGTACLATAAGFAALLLSPVPMVRSFGLMLCAGIGIAFLAAASIGFGALALRAEASAEGAPTGRIRAPAFLGSLLRRAARLRARLVARVVAVGKTALAVAIESPGRVLTVALALALCGWIAGASTKINSDIRQLVPSNLGELRDIRTLESATGVSGELDVMVNAPDLANPRVIHWMSSFKQRVLARHGFRGQFPSCRRAQLCPGTSLSDFFGGSTQGLSSAGIAQLIKAIPAYDSQAVITSNPRTGELGHTADISFGIRQMPLDQQQRLIDDIRSQINRPGGGGPPPGVKVALAGVPVLAAASDTALSGSRYWLTIASLIAVALALFAVYRSPSRALVPLIPILLATGWSALIIAAIGIPLNPMSATLGALVIAIATEFSVILAARYREERLAGHSLGEALRRAYARTGAAVLASGSTAIVGFAALMVSDVRMLREFGFVTVVDLGVALVGVMLVLPAVLVWAESSFEVRGVPLPKRLASLRVALLARGGR